MKFAYITLYVQDMDKSLALYHDLLGLAVLERQSTPDGELAFVGVTGQPSIELVCSPAFADTTYSGFSIGIEVPSLPEAAERMQAHGYPLLRGPFSPQPTLAFSYFRGPDGEEVQLIAHAQ